MTFNVLSAVQRYPLSPPLSPGENEDTDSAKMHQQQSESLTSRNFSSLPSQQQNSLQNNGAAYGSGPDWCRGGASIAGRAYGYNFEYRRKAPIYYGYHSGWADWQQRQQVSGPAQCMHDNLVRTTVSLCLSPYSATIYLLHGIFANIAQEWDSSYPPPRPQPRIEPHHRDSINHPITPPPESIPYSGNGYAYLAAQVPAILPLQQQRLTQNALPSAPTAQDNEIYTGSRNANHETHTRRVTRSQTSLLGAPDAAQKPRASPPQAESTSVVASHVLHNRIDKYARYNQANFGTAALTVGSTARIREGPHKDLTGLVKAVTNKGASIQVHLRNKVTILSLNKYMLDVVNGAPTQVPATLPGHQGASQARLQTRSSGEPKVYFVPRPSPGQAYLEAAFASPSASDYSRPLLVILDLNGTLLYRKRKGSNFMPRPHLDEFLEYLFSNHVVMVWSSARPHNVINMCQKFFTPEQYQRVAAIWTRDHLHLSQEAYNANTQVYKQLSWVWADAGIQAKNPVPGAIWDQSNTVLLDDSVEKSISEPFNLIKIDEFEGRSDQMSEDVLPQVALYLHTLRSQHNVSSYIRSQPMLIDPAMPRAAASALARTRLPSGQSPFLER